MLNDHTDRSRRDDATPVLDVAQSAAAVVRLMLLLVGIGVLLFGVYCGWSVFTHLRQVVQGAGNLEDAAKPIGEAIRAAEMEVTIPGQAQPVPLGATASVLLLFLWNLLWIYFPALLIKTGAWLMMLAVRDKDESRRVGERTN